MKTVIITIGDEILIGQVANTNAAYIGALLSENQVDIIRTSVVGDTIEEIETELANAAKLSKFVVVSGGLGPTHDDVTRDAVLKYFNTELVPNEKVLSDIEERFALLNREVRPLNRDQAMVPKNAEIIRNKLGTAPGYWIEKNGVFYVFMPGMPFEMKEMMTGFVLPKVRELTKSAKSITKRLTLLTTGLGESIIYERMGLIDDFLEGAKLAFLPSAEGVKLRITAEADSDEKAMEKIYEIEQKIRALIGRNVYGREEETMGSVLGRILNERELRLSIAESCTGGLISSIITDASGSSAYFDRSIVAYSNAAKVEILGVEESVIDEYGAVSAEAAKQMADGVRTISGSDLGLAVTGIMGPTGATVSKPVGTVFISVCDRERTEVQHFQFGDDRINNKLRTAQAALDMVRKFILNISR